MFGKIYLYFSSLLLRPHDFHQSFPGIYSRDLFSEKLRVGCRWPTAETLDYLKNELHAGPAAINLGPGEYIHINKGRLHAFVSDSPQRYYIVLHFHST